MGNACCNLLKCTTPALHNFIIYCHIHTNLYFQVVTGHVTVKNIICYKFLQKQYNLKPNDK